MIFSLIWPGELFFDLKWPSFEPGLEIIKTNILSKIHDDNYCLQKCDFQSVNKVFLWFGLVT